MIKPDQIRAARAMLRLEQKELARRAHVSVATVRRLEAEDAASNVAGTTVARIRNVLEEAGAEFIESGVRRRAMRNPADREARFRAIMDIAERAAALPVSNPDFSEADLYDENGLPR
ncbi:helix-turn-helix domain-containing protein [Azospirillum sp.]|uniref:helix-turn-helix domain-containing protein n=1 Tax=Azospirillum sp. TaxID=34012 RepID=UPI002D5C044B|nr:helix-turn-helix domain-containing protein [Azospirillum sp.]HYD66227.1 helix-turn-helix domain-containing protein [Azospirillum sp.]